MVGIDRFFASRSRLVSWVICLSIVGGSMDSVMVGGCELI